jgi:tRNA threonylcarbamoyladenosine biosynthesis protein TsaE
VILLYFLGDLGSGKTKFTEGFISFWSLEDEISSPTFTIVNEYSTPTIPIYHFDVYRLEDEDEFLAIGGEEYFDKGGVCIIEWADNIKDILPKNRLDIKIKVIDENKRSLTLNAYGKEYEELCEAVL